MRRAALAGLIVSSICFSAKADDGAAILLAPESFRLNVTSTIPNVAAHPEGEPAGVFVLNNWLFRAGDNLEWAKPEIDDRDWIAQKAQFREGNPPGWDGIGWFRTRVVVAPSYPSDELVMAAFFIGALEIYLDGNLIDRTGDLSAITTASPEETPVRIPSTPLKISLERGVEHVFAVRYGIPPTSDTERFDFPSGFILALVEPPALQELIAFDSHRRIAVSFGLGAFSLAIALLHLFLYYYQRSLTQNLYFAISCVGTSALVLTPLEMGLTGTLHTMAIAAFIFQMAMVVTGGFGILAQHTIFGHISAKMVRAVLIGVLVLCAVIGFLPMRFTYIVGSVLLIEQVRVVGKAVLRKQRGAWLVMLGCVAFAITGIAQMFNLVPEFTYGIGLMTLLICMSILLAQNFGRATRDLALLEVANAHQALQLEEAKKLEKALNALEAANEHLKKTQVQLVQSEKMASLGMLVAGVAHEINTPVGAISSVRDSMARALEKLRVALELAAPGAMETNPKIKATLDVLGESIKVIDSGSSRVAAIVKRLRVFARLDEADFQYADLHEGLDDTLLLVGHELKTGITVERKYGPLPKVQCYPSRMNQVFLNIIVNAKQAMGLRGTLTIETSVSNGHANIAISDTGSGISPQHLSKIFDPGFTTKGVGVGTGLGLSICYQIIADHGGEIGVKSELGKGTTFTLSIPLERAPTEAV